MEESFSYYRDVSVEDSDDSEMDEINETRFSTESNRGKNQNFKNKPNVCIAATDDENSDDDLDVDESAIVKQKSNQSNFVVESSDESDDVNESAIIRPKTNRVLRLLSDSESDDCAQVRDSARSDDVSIESDEDENFVTSFKNETRNLSPVTRLSIFGVKAKDRSDESDVIQSDNDENDSPSFSDDEFIMGPNPHVDLVNTSLSPVKRMDVSFSNMSFGNDVSSPMRRPNISSNNLRSPAVKNMDLSFTKESKSPLKDMNMSIESIEIVEKKVDIVNVSSDDEVQEVEMLTPKIKDKSIRKTIQPKINEMLGQSRIQSPKIYVSKQIMQNAMKDLDALKNEYVQASQLFKKGNMDKLPDKGARLRQRITLLESKLIKQTEKLAKMIPEPDNVTAAHVKSDGFVSWEQLQEASKAVKPRSFGAQALNTHMTQQVLTMERLKALHSSLDTRPSEDTMAEPPKQLITSLMPHQLQALAWLSWRETQQPRGGILADDMGLGKTLTMISLILHSKENNLDDLDVNDENGEDWGSKHKGKLITGGTLVVCPASLLSQWHNEIAAHCKRHSLRDEIHHGQKREIKANHLARNDVVITTYNIVQRDSEKNGVLMRIRWRRIILDEAHVVRNHKSLTATAIFNLSAYSRWCLTGTPVHNKDLDLFSLMKFLKCSPFDEITLWKKWIDNKMGGGQERLATVMKTLMLRRTKQQLQELKSIQSLPDKTHHQIEVELSKNEMSVYQKVLVFSKTLFAQFLHQRAERQNNTYNNTDHKYGGKQDEYFRMHRKMVSMKGLKQVKSHEILVLLLRLRQICCHPGLIHAMLEDEDDDLNKSECRNEVEVAMLHELSKLNIENDLKDDIDEPIAKEEGLTVSKALKQVLHVSNPVFDLNKPSEKISSVLKCLEEKVFVYKNDKAIIVSQWTGMLDIILASLKKMHIKTLTLSGKVPVTDRQEIIQQFNDPNSNVKILLLSLCAGGVGLNLVGGNHLLLVDLHWNPQLEAQAQDRIYRFGQKKNVHIYKFVTRDTVEQYIKVLQDKKLTLANNLLTGVKTHSSKLTIDDLKLLFNMH